MKKTIIHLKWILIAGFFAIAAASCHKPKTDFNYQLPRQFKPGDINITAGETQAVLSWNKSLFTAGTNTSYTLQVATDANFQGTPFFTQQTDTNSVTLTDSLLAVNQVYYARIKANASGSRAESGWIVSDSFKITGEQILFPVLDPELTDTSVILRWRPTAGLTKIVVTPVAGGTPINVTLLPADTVAHQKLVKGMTQLTQYRAEIFKNNTKKGTMTFTTKEHSIFAVILSPGDDLVTAVNNAADGDIIGLQPGTYDCLNSTSAYTNLTVIQKKVTIQSVSGNPNNTKVNFKEVTLKGTGAGITVRGIEFDGTAGNADYFINLTGASADADPSSFGNVLVDNCIVHKTNNCFLRGNRGAANAHKIDTIKVNNTIAYGNGGGSYHYFMLDKLEFKDLEILNSTIYDGARALISVATNMTFPTTPTILIDHSTINNWGFAGRNYILLDANGNVVNFTVQNSILANTPKPGDNVGTGLIRTNSSATVIFSNNDYFNLNTGGTTSTPLTFPANAQLANNQTIDLGWTATTTDFTLPQGSPLRTASTTNGPIGDPRWAF